MVSFAKKSLVKTVECRFSERPGEPAGIPGERQQCPKLPEQVGCRLGAQSTGSPGSSGYWAATHHLHQPGQLSCLHPPRCASLGPPGAPRTTQSARTALPIPKSDCFLVTMRAITLVVGLIALTSAELPVLSEGSGEDSDELFGDDDEGSGEFIEDLKAFGDHNRVLKVVPDGDDFDIHFGKDDDYYGEQR